MKDYIREFTSRAKESGFQRLAFYLEEKEGRFVSVFQGNCEKLEFSNQRLLFAEGEYQGFCGSVFIENFDLALIDEELAIMKESALVRKKEFRPYEFPHLDTVGETEEKAVEWLPLEELLQRLTKAEQAAYQADEHIVRVPHCSCKEHRSTITLMNEEGQQISDSSNGGYFSIGLGAQKEDEIQLGYEGKEFLLQSSYPDFEPLAKKAAESAAARLGASSYPTGKYPVLLDSSVVCQLLDAFMPAFFAKNIQNHMSVLEGKYQQNIAGENIVIQEIPTLSGGLCCRRFDDEGVLTSEKALIDHGVFRSVLYNRQSAAAAQQVSSGNGFKASFSDEVDCGYTNVVLQPGDKNREELLLELGQGLLIDDVSGVFAGANPVSGDFSLIAKGYRVEEGKKGSGVTQITVAGNFFELLEQVQSIGCDLEPMHSGHGCVYCPDLLIRQLMISGEE